MIRSMTGYGRAEGAYQGRFLVVELRSVNHRFCDVGVRLPRPLSSMEEVFKKKIQSRFTRGRFDLSIKVEKTAETGKRIRLDLDAAEAYCRLLQQLKKKLHLSGEIDVALISHFQDIISVSEADLPDTQLQKRIETVLGQAMSALEKMRKEEGKVLASDLLGHLQHFSERLIRVKALEKVVLKSYRARLEERVSKLSQGLKIDPIRLAQEVAILAERSDISEERARLGAHVGQFRKMLRKAESVGRALDFLLQEMHREVNTLSAKSNDLQISMQVVGMKSALEKIREQVQNIE
ncbi:MAG: YicC/YloC family endoribonuclease [Nitrospiria bacterium]